MSKELSPTAETDKKKNEGERYSKRFSLKLASTALGLTELEFWIRWLKKRLVAGEEGGGEGEGGGWIVVGRDRKRVLGKRKWEVVWFVMLSTPGD